MTLEGSSYIYCFPRRNSKYLLFDVFTRAMDQTEVNIYLEYVCEDGPKLLPDALPAEAGANCILLRVTRELLQKIMTDMTIIGLYDEYPVLMYHGMVHEFVQRLQQCQTGAHNISSWDVYFLSWSLHWMLHSSLHSAYNFLSLMIHAFTSTISKKTTTT